MEKFTFLHTYVAVHAEQRTSGQVREGTGTRWMPHCRLALDGHGPEEWVVSFHSDKAGPIVGVRSTDQCSKAKNIICEVPFQACCRHLVARLSNRNQATPAPFHSSVYMEPVLPGLEEVDERVLLDYYNRHRSDVSGLERVFTEAMIWSKRPPRPPSVTITSTCSSFSSIFLWST